jgi:hypothetical protein
MSAPGSHLHALPTPGDLTNAPCPHDQVEERISTGELAARAEVTRARRELPAVDPVVWDCYLGDLTDKMRRTSEADPIGIYASLLAAAGVYLGQNPRVQAGDDRHPLLVWPLIVGRTGGGRKGAGWSAARRLLNAGIPEFVVGNIRSGLTSGEGLAAIFAEADNEADASSRPVRGAKSSTGGLLPPGDRRLLVFEPEWAAVMARMRRDGNTLSATLRAAWEGGDLSTLNVTARVAPSSHVGLITHITPEEFRAKVSASDLAGGTYNRFLPIYVARAQFLPLSSGAPEDLVQKLGADLATRLGAGSDLGAIAFTATAETQWRDLYIEFGTDHGDNGPVEQFLARTAPNCLRIAAIHAAIDGGPVIGSDHLAAAAALVRYSIASVRTVFNHNEDIARLLAYIGEAGPAGRTRREITANHFGGNKKAEYISGLLDRLTGTGAVTRSERPRADGKPGRRAEVYIANGRDPTNRTNLRT